MKLRLLMFAASLAASLAAQVSYERLLHPEKEPQNWLTYSGSYASTRYSSLNQITTRNAGNLELKWIFQARSLEKFEATPLVINGIMYITEPPNNVVALDAKTGSVFWVYEYRPSPDSRPCCGRVNRGLGILGDTLYMGTIDAHVVAIDAKNGKPLWNVAVAEPKAGYAITHAPLVLKDKVIVGVAGGEYGIRGFIAAFDTKTGKEVWRANTIPGPGEPGNQTWAGESWKHGGGSAWITGSYDPELNLVYWGTGNPGPDWNGDKRPGDNLYTESALALDADTGKLKWYFQFTPHDEWDYDSVQIPVLVDANWKGTPRKLMYWANRNGFFYVLDRTNGEFLAGTPFAKQTWAKGLDAKGRPILADNVHPTTAGVIVYPGNQGATNWFSPSYSPRTGLFYISTWQDFFARFTTNNDDYVEGKFWGAGFPRTDIPFVSRGPVNSWGEDAGHGAFIAIDPMTGAKKWEFRMSDVTDGGLLTTASDLVFGGGREGYFYALDSRNGNVLWKSMLGGMVDSCPTTFSVDGKQYVSVGAGHALFVFGLRE
jgi:alcohol dehydrogenase (cytochrome c)